MTKEEILAMEAGEKLDLLVCEKVFDNKTFGSVKPYSTDISAAWQVKEEMNRQGFHFRLADYDEEGNQQAIFEKSGYEPFVAICPKAPEAISKAALSAKLEVSVL